MNKSNAKVKSKKPGKAAPKPANYEGWLYVPDSIDRQEGPKDGYVPARYFESLEDLLAFFAMPRNKAYKPKLVYGCEPFPPQFLDADEIIENCFVDSFEEAEEHVPDVARRAFEQACDDFNDVIEGIVSWRQDSKQVFRLVGRKIYPVKGEL